MTRVGSMQELMKGDKVTEIASARSSGNLKLMERSSDFILWMTEIHWKVL